MNLEWNITIIQDVFTNGFNINSLILLSVLAIVSSILVITAKNPIVSILYLISLFLSISVYLILIGLNFLGLSYILVYIGAISMLFLFILMLIDIRISELHINNNNSVFLGFLVSILFLSLSSNILPFNILTYFNIDNSNYYYLIFNNWDNNILENYDVISIGNVIYSNYSILLILVSLILLLAMIGAIIINIKETLV